MPVYVRASEETGLGRHWRRKPTPRPHARACGLAGLAGLGDVHTFADDRALAQQLQQLAQSAPQNAQIQALLAAQGPRTSAGQYRVSQIVAYYLSKATGTAAADADYTALASALAAANQILSTGSGPTAVTTHAIQDVRALTATMRQLLQALPSNLTSQANAILDRTTSAPVNTVSGIMTYYERATSSTYTDRDWSLLAQAVADMQALIQTGGAPLLPPPSAPAPSSAPTSPGSPATFFPPVPSYTPTPGAPTPSDPATAPAPGLLDGNVTLPVLGDVPKTYVAGALAALGALVALRLRRSA